MDKNKPTLPPRKWYSLQQTADKLTREFGKPVTVDDLLPFSIYINHNVERTCINDLVFSAPKSRKIPCRLAYLNSTY